MKELAVVLTIVMLFQLLLSLYQIKYYHRFMKQLVDKYQGTDGYHLVSEIVKKHIKSVIVVLVYDNQKEIVEAYSLRGLTIFSTFQAYEMVQGHQLTKHLSARLNMDKDKMRRQAMTRLMSRYT